MKDLKEITAALNTIRAAIDADVTDVDIESVKNKALTLSQLIGLSAETLASVKKLLHKKEIEVFKTLKEGESPTIQSKRLKAFCGEEIAVLEYANRLNAGLVHGIDCLRSVISLYKTELENSLKQ